MTTPTASTGTPPPSAREILAAVERLDAFANRQRLTQTRDVADAARVLLAVYSDLAQRHGAQAAELEQTRDRVEQAHYDRAELRRTVAQHRAREQAVRTAYDEAGRYVDTVDVLRALDRRPAAPGTL